MWLAAALTQAKRTKESMWSYFSVASSVDVALQVQAGAEARLFVVAVNQVGLAAALVGKLAQDVVRPKADDIRRLVVSFEAECPGIRKLRNVVAHHDEYILGIGREQRGSIPELSYIFGTHQFGIAYAEGEPPLTLEIDAIATAMVKLGNGIESLLSSQSGARAGESRPDSSVRS
ncbi:hypothetical protein ABTW72_12175 [Micromonospora sp. NPDC127501]|uniref:hypothetical protein n=1 Tax=Micromonospora sp. NPDC127501 TaxID=3154872 RepID=UPI003330B38D